jgi:hypothetical protein
MRDMNRSILLMIGIAIALGCGATRASDDSATDDTDSNTSVPSAFTLYRLTADHCHLPIAPEFRDEEACVRRLFGSQAFAQGEKIGTDRFNSIYQHFGCGAPLSEML